MDGETYAWRDGEDVLLDETYIHYAENTTNQNRIILCCDIERPMTNPLARGFNQIFPLWVIAARATRNREWDRVGGG